MMLVYQDVMKVKEEVKTPDMDTRTLFQKEKAKTLQKTSKDNEATKSTYDAPKPTPFKE